MGGFGEYPISMKMRDIIDRIATSAIDRERPRYKYATVQSIDRPNYKCTVRFPGESTDITVSMGGVQPSAVGQRVRVAGLGGDYFVDDVMGKPYLTLAGAASDGDISSGGAITSVGPISTDDAISADGAVASGGLASGAAGLRAANGKVWFATPAGDGTNNDLIRYDETTNRYHFIADQATSDGNANADVQVSALLADTLKMGPNGYNRHFIRNLQHMITGGGILTSNATSVAWSFRFIAISIARGADSAANGYFEIQMPPDGTVIPGLGSTPSVTVAGGAIPFGSWNMLWYKLPLGGTSTSLPGNFFVTNYTAGGNFTPTDDMIPIVAQNLDGASHRWRWCTGATTDYWHAPTLLNSWINYGSGWDTAAYKKENGIVYLKGLIKFGSPVTANMFILPAGYRPIGDNIFTGITNTNTTGGASAGTAHTHGLASTGVRIDILSTGEVLCNTPSAAAGFISLAGISFPAGG